MTIRALNLIEPRASPRVRGTLAHQSSLPLHFFMFTLDQIDEAHSRVKSGADFPQFMQDMIELGVARNSIFVADGHAEYWDKDGGRLVSDAAYPTKEIADACDSDEFITRLKLHQQGGTDYPTFCNDCAETGIVHWTIDMAGMTCTYFDQAENEVLVEQIPMS